MSNTAYIADRAQALPVFLVFWEDFGWLVAARLAAFLNRNREFVLNSDGSNIGRVLLCLTTCALEALLGSCLCFAMKAVGSDPCRSVGEIFTFRRAWPASYRAAPFRLVFQTPKCEGRGFPRVKASTSSCDSRQISSCATSK